MAKKRKGSPRGRAPNSSGKPGQKKRKRKLRLSLKSSSIKEAQGYVDQIGWTTTSNSNRLEAPESPKIPEFIKHQCSGCGYVLKVPRPKRDRYTIVCPSCETKDEFGYT